MGTEVSTRLPWLSTGAAGRDPAAGLVVPDPAVEPHVLPLFATGTGDACDCDQPISCPMVAAERVSGCSAFGAPKLWSASVSPFRVTILTAVSCEPSRLASDWALMFRPAVEQTKLGVNA